MRQGETAALSRRCEKVATTHTCTLSCILQSSPLLEDCLGKRQWLPPVSPALLPQAIMAVELEQESGGGQQLQFPIQENDHNRISPPCYLCNGIGIFAICKIGYLLAEVGSTFSLAYSTLPMCLRYRNKEAASVRKGGVLRDAGLCLAHHCLHSHFFWQVGSSSSTSNLFWGLGQGDEEEEGCQGMHVKAKQTRGGKGEAWA